MTSANLKNLIRLAGEYPGPISTAVLDAAYGNMVHPGRLQEKLQEAGLNGDVIQGNQTVTLSIRNEAGELIAWSKAPSAEEAILHSVLGYLRERETEARASEAVE
jgi:hypothetical protein